MVEGAVSSRLRSVGWMLLPPERPGDSLCCMKEWDNRSKNAQRSNAAVQFSAQNFQWGLRPVDESNEKRDSRRRKKGGAVEHVQRLRKKEHGGHVVTVAVVKPWF